MLCRYSWKLFWAEDWSWHWLYDIPFTWWHANHGYVALTSFICLFVCNVLSFFGLCQELKKYYCWYCNFYHL